METPDLETQQRSHRRKRNNIMFSLGSGDAVAPFRDPVPPFSPLSHSMKTLQRPGAALHYLREGAGIPVILVQGVGVIAEGWRPQIEGLRNRCDVVAPDNRGIGGSTWTDRKSVV